jgi:hypothetical protein
MDPIRYTVDYEGIDGGATGKYDPSTKVAWIGYADVGDLSVDIESVLEVFEAEKLVIFTTMKFTFEDYDSYAEGSFSTYHIYSKAHTLVATLIPDFVRNVFGDDWSYAS